MGTIARLKEVVECHGQQVIDDDHPRSVHAVGGQEHRVVAGPGRPADVRLRLGAPCRQRREPHGHTRVAAVVACEKPSQTAGTRGVLAADASALAGEGMGHA